MHFIIAGAGTAGFVFHGNQGRVNACAAQKVKGSQGFDFLESGQAAEFGCGDSRQNGIRIRIAVSAYIQCHAGRCPAFAAGDPAQSAPELPGPRHNGHTSVDVQRRFGPDSHGSGQRAGDVLQPGSLQQPDPQGLRADPARDDTGSGDVSQDTLCAGSHPGNAASPVSGRSVLPPRDRISCSSQETSTPAWLARYSASCRSVSVVVGERNPSVSQIMRDSGDGASAGRQLSAGGR